MTDQRFLQKYEALLAKVQNPATPAEELDALFDLAEQKYKRFLAEYPGSFHEINWRSYKDILKAIAQNPNCNDDTLEEAFLLIPLEAIKNPIIPLLILEGSWKDWYFDSFCRMRSAAFETKQDFFPALTTVCYPEWRRERQIYSQEPTYHQEVCGSEFCATCFPYSTARMIERWRAMCGK